MITEHQIQAAFFQWVRLKEKSDWRFELIYSVPNFGLRSFQLQKKLKAEGMKAGVWDILIDYPAKGFNFARIETKSIKGKLTASQIKMGELYRKAGGLLYVGKSTDSLINFVENYFDLQG
jgi:hypothetical protein